MLTYGLSRDSRLLAGLEKWRYMTTAQAAELYFKTIKNPAQRHNKARERLKKLHDRGLCYRMRIPGEHYIYSLSNKGYNHKVQHYLALVEVWLQLQTIKPSGTVLTCESEVRIDDLIIDLWVEAKNNFRNETRNYFIEVELNSSGDIKEKFFKYEALLWRRKRDFNQSGILVIATSKKLSGLSTESGISLKVVRLNNLAEDWQW